MVFDTECAVTPSQAQSEENSVSETREEDYKRFYNECNCKIAELTEQFQKRLFNITTRYDVLKQEHDVLTQYVQNVEHSRDEYEKVLSYYDKTANEKDTALLQHNSEIPRERESVYFSSNCTPQKRRTMQ